MNEPLALSNLIIIGLTVYFSYRGFTNSSFVNRYLFEPRSILVNKQYERLITSSVLHADWAHLIFNMFSLYSFGSAIELQFGPTTFLTTYLAGILGGNLLALLIHRKENYRALGASGGVCGVIFACIFLIPGSTVFIFGILPIPAYIFAVLFMLFSYYGVRAQKGNIGHDAHLGGAIIGLITATALHPSIVPNNPILYPVVMLLSISLMVLLYIKSHGFRMPRRQIRPGPGEEELFTFNRNEDENNDSSY